MRASIGILILSLLSSYCAHEREPSPILSGAMEPKESTDETKVARWIKQGQQYAIDGLYREALQAFDKVLKIDNKNHLAHKSVGIIQVKTGNYNKAVRHLEIAIKNSPNDFDSNFYIAEAYRTKDQYDDAVFHYRVALKSDPKHVLTLKALSWSYYKIRYYKAALDHAKQLYKLDKNDPQASIILARILTKVGKEKTALLLLKRSLLKANKDQAAYLESVLGDVYFALNKTSEAEETYIRALKDQPLLAGALLGLAKIEIKKGQDISKAIDYLQRAGRIKPDLIETFFYLGKAHSKDKPRLSKKYFTKFHKLASGDPEYSEQLDEVSRFLKR